MLFYPALSGRLGSIQSLVRHSDYAMYIKDILRFVHIHIAYADRERITGVRGVIPDLLGYLGQSLLCL